MVYRAVFNICLETNSVRRLNLSENHEVIARTCSIVKQAIASFHLSLNLNNFFYHFGCILFQGCIVQFNFHDTDTLDAFATLASSKIYDS